MFPKGEKDDLGCIVLFFKIVLRQQKHCKYQMLIKCIRSLIWAGLNSEVWIVFILQGSSRPTRLPDPTQCVQYCFNFISVGNQDLDQGLQPLYLLFKQLCLFTYFDVSKTSAIFIRNYDHQMSVWWSKNRRYVTVGSPPHLCSWSGIVWLESIRLGQLTNHNAIDQISRLG